MGFVKSLISSNFMEYASYVIKERAIPHINDGFKPVQRRILHALFEVDDGRFHKVANIVGHSMKYHPHGDASIYSALVTLANKEYFIDKQGNFGNIFTGDEAAAARYIECRLSQLAKEVLFNKDLTEYIDSYDGRNKEPVTLPAKVPSLLMLGAEGIAVGMSTKILPHNFNELLEAQIKILKKEQYEIYPDFLQGGEIDITEYNQGNGKVRVRAKIEVKNNKTLLITQVPYGTNCEMLINSVEAAAKKGKIKISSINDFTAENVEIEIKTARGEDAHDTIKSLFAYTDCEMSISANLIVIVDNKPKQMSVNQVLEYNTKKLVKDLKRELEISLERLMQKLHDLTLEQIFIENRIYKKIEELKTYPKIISTIKRELNKFKELFIRELTDEDIEKLLQIKIKRISRFDIENHKNKLDDIVRQIDSVKKGLKNIKKYTINYLTELKNKYGENYKRRTKIVKMDNISIKEIDSSTVKVFWDKRKGFIGTDVKGDYYFEVSPYDKFSVIFDNGTYRVLPVENKLFIDTNILHLEKLNKNSVFSIIYTDLDAGISYAKKFKIEKYILKKTYNLIPCKNGKLQYFTTNPKEKIIMHYIPKPRQKSTGEFDFSTIDVKHYYAKGNIATKKEIKEIFIAEQKKNKTRKQKKK